MLIVPFIMFFIMPFVMAFVMIVIVAFTIFVMVLFFGVNNCATRDIKITKISIFERHAEVQPSDVILVRKLGCFAIIDRLTFDAESKV